MSLSVLSPRHIFGFRGEVPNSIAYLEDGQIAYVAGHSIILQSLESNKQRFVPGTVECTGISAMAISGNKKILAVAERSEKAMITVYDVQTLKRRKVLLSTDAGSQEYVSLSFSPDGKLLLAQGGAPEWNLLLWQWEKSKVTSYLKSSNQQGAAIHQCLFCPGDSQMVSVVGNCILKTFKTTDSILKQQPSPLAKRDPQNYLCHLWISEGDRERLILGADNGDILVVEGAELKYQFTSDQQSAVTSLEAFSKGFLAGLANGWLLVYEKDEKDGFRRIKSLNTDNQGVKIQSLCVSPSEDLLAVGLANWQLYTLQLSNVEILKNDENNFEHIGSSFHQQSITGMDTCIRRPLIATCSLDKSIRIWNYIDKSVELCKYYQDEAYSVALHPTGTMLLAGFADKLRLMTILMDDFRVYREYSIKACRECQFSNGGHLFAAVNGNTISVYNAYTSEVIGNLRGHNSKVRSLCWSPDDSKLISAGVDGAVYEWRLKDLKREKENVLKGCNYTCVVCTADCKQLYAVGSDKKLKELEDSQVSGTQISKEIDTGVLLTQIVLPQSGKTMFAATDSGCIRTYRHPLSGEFHEFKCHNEGVVRLRLNHDDTLLFSCSSDGTILIFDVKDKDTKLGRLRDQDKLAWAEEVLVTKGELEDKKQRMSELEAQVSELTSQNEYQLKLKEMDMSEKIKELTDKFTQELEADRHKYDLLMQEKNELEMEYEEKIKATQEKGQHQIQALDTQYQQKIMVEVERYQTLMAEKEMLNERWDDQNALLVESHERVLAEVTEEYEAKLAEEQLQLEKVMQEKADHQNEFEEVKRQLEEDADREIEELKDRYEQKLTTFKDQVLRLDGENGILKKKFKVLEKEIEEHKEDITNLFDQKRELYQTISSLEKDIAGLKKEIRERDQTIGEKEKRIFDLKKKNQELEKFKFVLDYKIKELKKQIEPKDEEIATMKDQIQDMDHELERYHKTSGQLELTIQDFKLKQTGIQQELLKQRQLKGNAQTSIESFQYDLHEVTQHVQSPKELKEKVLSLYQKHVKTSVQPMNVQDNIQREYNRQRDYLERTVESLKQKLTKDVERHRRENLKIMRENVALIREINELRREIKSGRSVKQETKQTTSNAEQKFLRELEIQRDVINELRQEVENRQGRIQELENLVMPRPVSRERLPPMEGFQPDQQQQEQPLQTT